jgi:ribose transport system ATP-binding protein
VVRRRGPRSGPRRAATVERGARGGQAMEDGDVVIMERIQKSFAGLRALNGADFRVKRGEVHALVGGNGAGKSTLMKILTGVLQRDSGTFTLRGKPVELNSGANPEALGVAMIFQEFSLIPSLSVAQNVFMKRESTRMFGWMVNDRATGAMTTEVLESVGVDIDPFTKVKHLSAGQMQLVEIAKALSKQADILVMDEPTASLSEHETGALFELMKRLNKKGITIIYISHRMDEILRVSDRITVLKDGRSVLTEQSSNMTKAKLIQAMLGEHADSDLQWSERFATPAAEPILMVRDLVPRSRMKPISFDLCPGEIVGLVGLMGSGRTRIAESIFGIHKPVSGSVKVNGKEIRSVTEAIAEGVALVPENRRREGLLMDQSIRANIMVTALENYQRWPGIMDDAKGKRIAVDYIKRLRIKASSAEGKLRTLSGGTQQKVVFSKWLATDPKLLILDEPTIGIDIGAKADILKIIKTIADAGVAVLMVSSEIPELLAACDRLLVIKDGALVGQLNRAEISSEEQVHHAIQGI